MSGANFKATLDGRASEPLTQELWNDRMPYDPLPELLALKAVVQFLLTDRVREYQDTNAAVFEISKACSEIIGDASVGAPDPERIKQSALRHLDDMFLSIKSARL
jgi:hypothetical protein